MTRARRSVAAAVGAATILLAAVGTTTAANAAPTPPVASPSYHLYDTPDTQIMANCLGGDRYIKDAGIKSIAPHVYKTLRSTTGGGTLKTDVTVQDGFNSADKQLWCLHGDFMWRFYGINKIQRTGYVHWLCYGGGCTPTGHTMSQWANKDWD